MPLVPFIGPPSSTDPGLGGGLEGISIPTDRPFIQPPITPPPSGYGLGPLEARILEILSQVAGAQGADPRPSLPPHLTTGHYIPETGRDLSSEQFDLARQVSDLVGADGASTLGRIVDLVNEGGFGGRGHANTFLEGLFTSNPRFTRSPIPGLGGDIGGLGSGGGKGGGDGGGLGGISPYRDGPITGPLPPSPFGPTTNLAVRPGVGVPLPPGTIDERLRPGAGAPLPPGTIDERLRPGAGAPLPPGTIDERLPGLGGMGPFGPITTGMPNFSALADSLRRRF